MKKVLGLILLITATISMVAVSGAYAGDLSVAEKMDQKQTKISEGAVAGQVEYTQGYEQYASVPPRMYGFQRQIEGQEKRINKGIRSGQITRDDAATLHDNLSWIRSRISRLGDTGRLTPDERGRIQAMLDDNNKMIYSERHTGVRRLY